MRPSGPFFVSLLLVLSVVSAAAQPPAAQPAQAATPLDPVRTLVGRLELEPYKATIKGLAQFGDRRQGTDRNRAATDWIEAQLDQIKQMGLQNYLLGQTS